MLDYIIVLKDKNFAQVSKQEANAVWATMAASSFVEIPRFGKRPSFEISHVGELKAWFAAEQKRLSEFSKTRCRQCLAVYRVGESCNCRPFKKPPTMPDLGGSPSGIISNLESKMKNRKMPDEDLLKKICDGVLKKHSWGKDCSPNSLRRFAIMSWRSNNFEQYLST